MATCSFEKPIIIKDDRALDVIIQGLEKPMKTSTRSMDITAKLHKGRSVLAAKSLCRSKTTYRK